MVVVSCPYELVPSQPEGREQWWPLHVPKAEGGKDRKEEKNNWIEKGQNFVQRKQPFGWHSGCAGLVLDLFANRGEICARCCCISWRPSATYVLFVSLCFVPSLEPEIGRRLINSSCIDTWGRMHLYSLLRIQSNAWESQLEVWCLWRYQSQLPFWVLSPGRFSP